MHILSCFIQSKSILLIPCVFWIFFQNAGSKLCFRFFFITTKKSVKKRFFNYFVLGELLIHEKIQTFFFLILCLKTTIVLVAFCMLARILGECLTIHSPPVPFFSLSGDYSCTLIPLFRPGSIHSGSASWDNCGQMFPDKLHASLFPGRFAHYAWTVAQSSHIDFIGSKVYVCLGVTSHLHFWQNDRGLLHATAVTRGWNGHRIRVSTLS